MRKTYLVLRMAIAISLILLAGEHVSLRENVNAWSYNDLPLIQWRSDETQGVLILSPSRGITVDSQDRLVSVNYLTGVVTVLSSDHQLITKFGHYGADPGEFGNAQRVEIDSAGNFYVLDLELEMVTKFDANGDYLFRFGSAGSAPGEMNSPAGLALDISGNIFVADTGNHRIQKFTPDGTFILEFGSNGTGAGQFNIPEDIKVASDGTLFVVDRGNKRIQKFDANGNHLLSWGGNGTGNGQFNNPYSIDIDSSDIVSVLELGTLSANKRIQKFDLDGTYLSKFSISAGYGLAVNSNGEIYISSLSSTGVIRKYNSAGTLIESIPSTSTVQTYLKNPYNIDIDSEGLVYVTNNAPIDGHLIKKFSTTGELLLSFGERGFAEGEIMFPFDVAVNSSGEIYVSDDNQRVQKFSDTGNFIEVVGQQGFGEGEYSVPFGLAIDAQDNIYIADTGNGKVLKLDANGNYLLEFGAEGIGEPDLFPALNEISLDSQGNIYTVDQFENKLRKFSSQGILLDSPLADITFGILTDVAVDDNDVVYAVDGNLWQVLKYDQDANLLSTFGEYGFYNYEYQYPIAIAIEGDNLTLLDIDNNGGPASRVISYKYDRLPPVLSITEPTTSQFNSNSLTLTGSAEDEMSAISGIEFSLDTSEGSWSLCSATDGVFDEQQEDYLCTLSALNDGLHTLYIRSTDSYTNSNTEANWVSYSFTIDSQGPSGSISINSGAATTDSTSVNLSLQATDMYSQVTEMRVCNDSAYANCDFETYTSSKEWTLQPNVEIAEVFVQYMDSLGNISASYVDEIKVQKPVVPVTPAPVPITAPEITSNDPLKTTEETSQTETGDEDFIEITVTIRDKHGNPLTFTDVLFESMKLVTDANGKITVKVEFGRHTFQIEHEGELYSLDLVVERGQSEYTLIVREESTSKSLWIIYILTILGICSSVAMFVFKPRQNRYHNSR